MNFLRITPILCITLISACGWVDSTGKQNSSVGGNNTSNENTLGINDGEIITINEQSSISVQLNGGSANYRGWSWQPTENADLAQCASEDGFIYDYAKTSLGDACTDPDYCNIQITETSHNGVTGFELTVPQLRSSAALSYELSVTKPDGAFHTQAHTICAIAINEAPLANSDRYRVISDRSRFVAADDYNALLNNDYDDIDDRNAPLYLYPETIDPPRYADFLELYGDGSFLYRYNNEIELLPGEELFDSFTYQITDGVHISTASVSIAIVESNRAPRRDERIDDLYLELDDNGEAYLYLDVYDYFSDRDGNSLQFFSTGGELFDSGKITLSEEGVLSGSVSVQEIGEYRMTIIATDGLARAADTFEIEIYTAYDEDNSYPVADDISNREVQNYFEYDVSEFFYDADGDRLFYSATGLPPFVAISEDGVISGTSSYQNDGVWFIEVTALDNRGGYVTDGFNLTINN